MVHDAWCWNLTSLDITVGHVDTVGLEFSQTGFILHATLSHDIDVGISQGARAASRPDIASEKTFHLIRGPNRFCLANPGVYNVRPSSCFRFEQVLSHSHPRHCSAA